MRTNIYGCKKRMRSINNDMIKVMYKLIDISTAKYGVAWPNVCTLYNRGDWYHALHTYLLSIMDYYYY